MIGNKFGHWYVLEKGIPRKHNTYWICQCCCGVKKEIAQFSLKNGSSTNCGCKSIMTSRILDGDKRRKEIRMLLKKGYSQRDILANIRTSTSMITQERRKMKIEERNRK